jgi:hypothetical protein
MRASCGYHAPVSEQARESHANLITICAPYERRCGSAAHPHAGDILDALHSGIRLLSV